jgi:class I fructose-bisphosphate aldolase
LAPEVNEMNRLDFERYLGSEGTELLTYRCQGIAKDRLHLPGGDFVERVFASTDRSIRVLVQLERLFGSGRLGGTGYLSILPVDQGIEHSAGASFAKNPDYFDPENIVRLAVDGGCNAVASTLGVLGSVARRYAHKIPFIVKLNHNELLTYPNRASQFYFGSVEQAFDMGAAGIGATVYFGSEHSQQEIEETTRAFRRAHELGMFTVLWCYLRNPAFKTAERDYHVSADLTGQANHLGVTIEADIVKQKLPENNGGFAYLNQESTYGKYDKRIYTELTKDHPIEYTRYQVANSYMGRAGLINSGGASGKDDFGEAVRTAVINKRAGGMGLISGRKAFQRPHDEGVALLHTIQDVYLSPDVTIA